MRGWRGWIERRGRRSRYRVTRLGGQKGDGDPFGDAPLNEALMVQGRRRREEKGRGRGERPDLRLLIYIPWHMTVPSTYLTSPRTTLRLPPSTLLPFQRTVEHVQSIEDSTGQYNSPSVHASGHDPSSPPQSPPMLQCPSPRSEEANAKQ